jgi:hypothetical protein
LRLIKKLALEIIEIKLDIKVTDGRSHKSNGYVNAPFAFDGKHISYQRWWCTLYAELLLGMEFWEKFGIVPKIEVAAIKSEGTTAVNVYKKMNMTTERLKMFWLKKPKTMKMRRSMYCQQSKEPSWIK